MKTKQNFLLSVIMATIMILSVANVFPCSTVLLKNNNCLLVGRNLDTPVDLPGYLCINIRGEKRVPLILPIKNSHSTSWRVKYGSVTFTAMGRGFSDGGMNEKGLVIEEMSLPDTEFLIDSNHTYLTSPQWIQYQLDNFSTVEEVIENLDSVLPIGWAWHFFVADKNGHSASIEFVKGKLIVHKDKNMPNQCLSNSLYSKSVAHYVNINNLTIPKRLVRQSDQNNSLERFAIASQKSKDFKKINPHESVDFAFDMLSCIADREGYAKRSIVYDVKNQAVYFRTNSNWNLRKLFFKDLDFSSNNKYLDITLGYKGNILNQLKKCTLKNELDLHNKLVNLLYTFFKPDDEFPNLGVKVKTYLDKTYDYFNIK